MIGYKRLNKSVGIRNYVLIMSAADNVNPLAKKYLLKLRTQYICLHLMEEDNLV